MATRDLTVPYLRLRSALHRKAPGRFDEGGNTNLLAGGAAPGGVDNAPLAGLQGASPVYVDMVTDVQSDVNGIQMKMDDLAKAHDQRLKIGFDPSAEAEKEREIDILTADITRTFNLAAAKLKRIARHGDANAADGTESKVIKKLS